jgi:hypothetical protein
MHINLLLPTDDWLEQTPSGEANKSSNRQEIPRILWNPEFHKPVPILSQITPLHDPTPTSVALLEYLLNITFPSTPVSFKYSLSRKIPHQNLVCVSPLPHT